MRYTLRPETVDKLKSLPTNFGFNGLGETVAKRTYMRGAETWADVVIRVVEGTMSIRKDHYIKNSLSWNDEKNHTLADNLAFGMFDMKWLPPGRGLWMMGTDYAYKRGSAALNNCGAINTEDDLVFAAEWSMDMLMNGVGIGFSTGWRGEVKPAVKDDFELYVIPDSREGWVESIIKLMCSYINSPKYGTCKFPKFDYSQIRPAGTPIAGFGGVASGSEPLQKLHTRIESYLDNFCNGYIETIKSGETIRKHYDHTRLIADIFNAIGACVVAGNVRRCMAKGSLVHTKTGPIPIENIKIGDELESMHAAIWHTVVGTFDQGFQRVIKITTSHNTFVCTPNHKVAVVIPRTNPVQYEWKYAGELVVGQDQLVSSVFNPDTIFEAEMKGRLSMMPRLPVDILSITNETEKIQTYDIEVDDSHMFFCDGHLVHNSAEISTGDIHDDTFLNLKNIEMNPERADISWMSNNSVKLKAALDYDDYSYLPMIAKRIYENGEPGIINLTNMQKYGRFGKEMGDEADMFNPCVTDDTWVATSVGLQQVHDLVGVPFTALVDNKQYECRTGFFLTGQKPVFTLSTREGFVLRATADHQIMTPCGAWVELGRFGVGDKIRLVNNESSKITLLNNEATVKSITFSGFEGVYDATIEDIHAFSANGIYVHNCGEICLEGGNKKKPAGEGDTCDSDSHNAIGGELCNLSEVFPNRCNGIEEFFEAIKHACFYASTVSLLPTHRPESNSVIARNRRIGVSISGIAQVISNVLPSGWPTMNYTLLTKVLREGYKILRTYNMWLAKEAGVPPSIRVSTIKPSGSISLLAGATPGMHFPVSRFAIRRVRIGMNSPLTPTLIASKVPYEKDLFSDNTYVFEFTIDHGPVRSAEVVSPWEQFALLAMLQRCWSDNAVSCTIYFDKTNKFLPLVNESREQLKRIQDENLLDDWVLKEFTKKIEDLETKATTVANETIADIEKMLAMFVPVLKSVSMLPHSNHTYKQAPYEPIDEKEYKRRVAEMGIVNLSAIGGMVPIGSKFCTNDVCEL
jgi:ribonucleotide reductase alpha subunit